MLLLRKEKFSTPAFYKLVLHEEVQEILYVLNSLRCFISKSTLTKDLLLDLIIASNDLVQYSAYEDDNLIMKERFSFIDSTIRTLLNKLED